MRKKKKKEKKDQNNIFTDNEGKARRRRNYLYLQIFDDVSGKSKRINENTLNSERS